MVYYFILIPEKGEGVPDFRLLVLEMDDSLCSWPPPWELGQCSDAGERGELELVLQSSLISPGELGKTPNVLAGPV